MAHDYGSFSYKTTNENIKKILDARSDLNNAIQVAMPFVKATTTIRHDFLGKGNIGFTLGLHGINKDVEYADMYAAKGGSDPLIGYTYDATGNPQPVYAVNPIAQIPTSISQIFDKQSSLISYPNNSNFVRIPPPGINNVTIGRNKNGLLAMAQLEISIPSLIQLETLHRTFLVPGVGMILEWGQQFAPHKNNQTFFQSTDITDHIFPWHNRPELEKILDKLARRQLGLKDILEQYVYPSNGQYMWMFGRIANFQITSNSDGSFKANIKIVGPSEDAWAYDTKNTVVPRKDNSSDFFCASDANSIYRYFADTAVGGLNLKTLITDVRSGKGKFAAWKDHIAFFEQGNKSSEGEDKPQTETPTTEQKSFAEDQDAYFMTWRFFVNVVINDEEKGVKAIFKNAGMDVEKLKTIGLLLPFADGPTRSNTNISGLGKIDDPKENFVGMNKHLRSVDPSVLIIVNEMAANEASKNPQYDIIVNGDKLLDPTDDSKQFTNATVAFEKSAEAYVKNSINPDMGFLSSGVWINHKAVVESMISADTFLRGIVNLLNRMNQATMNYWQLTLDIMDGDAENQHPDSYSVIDANFRENSIKAVEEFLKKVHTFNKYINTQNNTLVGSDVIECSVDLSLPRRLFSQIATLGLLSKNEIEKVSLPPNEEDTRVSMKVSDPNNTMAEMFGILSLSSKDETGQCPDLTIIPVDETQKTKGICGKGNSQLVAGTGGSGYQTVNLDPKTYSYGEVSGRDAAQGLGQKQYVSTEAVQTLLSSEECRKCEPCFQKEAMVAANQQLTLAAPFRINGQTVPEFPNLTFLENTYNTTVSRQLLADINNALPAGRTAVINSAWRAPDYTGQAPKSRHKRGLAVDIAGINENRQYYDAETPDGDQKITELVNNLVQAGYTRTNSENPSIKKAILWQVVNHFNHVHISRLDDTDTIPPPKTITPPADTMQRTTSPTQGVIIQQCTDEDFKAIGNGDAEAGRDACKQCKNAKETLRQNTVIADARQALDAAVRKFPGFQKAFRYVEIFPEIMVASIAASADGVYSNAFGASPGSLSIGGDIVLPGINGLRVGELFWIDRIPAFYKAFGAFQVLSIEDTIDINGWKTKIHARFNYLGNRWKEAMYTKLGIGQ